MDTKIYLIYCEIGNCKHWIKSCIDPQKYFKNYDALLEYLKELISYENSYSFHEPFPHDELRYYKSSYDELAQTFLFRAWEACLNRAAEKKIEATRLKIIQDFFFQMESYRPRFTSGALAVFENLKNETIDLSGIQKREAPPPLFDSVKECELYEAVRNSHSSAEAYFSIMQLMLFYYKYRTLKDVYLDYCIKLCRADIALLSKVDKECQRRHGTPFTANLPAFDKLYSIYMKRHDYINALLVSQEYLNCPQRGNEAAQTMKIQKRIDLCKKKLSLK